MEPGHARIPMVERQARRRSREPAGHFGFPIGEFIRENLDWLDRYLGPVARVR